MSEEVKEQQQNEGDKVSRKFDLNLKERLLLE